MKKVLLLISALFIYDIANASCDTCKMNIGMNLYGVFDWGTENPFVNIMKMGRTWRTQNIVWVEGGQNPENSGVIDYIIKDTHGYPLELPFYSPGLDLDTSQAVYTGWSNTGSLPGGQYVVLYDGDGEIYFSCDASIVSQTQGRIVVNVTPGICNTMQLKISRSTFGNHIRNIRFLMPGTEFTYQTQHYNPAWLDKLGPFKTIRFMDWGATNNSPNITWNNRAKIDYYTWTTNYGVPYEEMIYLCNFLNANIWINIPHQADNDYITQMARLVRDNLNPDLKIYVEYSNEIWNSIFSQEQYLRDNGNQSVPWPERIVPFIQNALDIWSDQFAGQMNRLIRVVGMHIAFSDISQRICYNMIPSSFDAVSPAAYITFTPFGYLILQSLGASATVNDVKALARDGRDSQSFSWVIGNKRIADSLHKKFIFYEGGQHLTPYPFGSVQPYNQALVDIQTDSSMYNIYNEWFAKLRTLANDLLFMHYAFAAPLNGQSGSWGALESVNQNPPFIITAPKYQALLDNMIEFKSLQLTVLMQGFYDNINNALVKDTITVFLRNASTPHSIVDSAQAYLNGLGIATFTFSKPQNEINYYIQIKHRNSIETWSKLGGEHFSSSFLNYDFTTFSSQAFGNNLILKGTKYCIFSGDVNQDGFVDISDLSTTYNDLKNSQSGYLTTDVNGDNIVDVSDLSIVYNNLVNSIEKITP